MSVCCIHDTVSLQDKVTDVFQYSELRISQPSTLLSVHAASDQTSALGRNKGTSTFRVFGENRLIDIWGTEMCNGGSRFIRNVDIYCRITGVLLSPYHDQEGNGSPATCNVEETCLPGLPMSWSSTLFRGSVPVGLPPVPCTEKTIEREVYRAKDLSAPR
jgi:hypothetical protein